MQDKKRELFQSRMERLKKENLELKIKLDSLKKENSDNIKSLMKMETLLNCMPAGLILIQDGKVLRANNTILEQLGYRDEDIIGIDYRDLILSDEREYISRIHKLWESGRMSPDQYETRLATSSGTPVFYEIRCRRIRFQNRTAFLLIATGIKERLEKEQEKAKNEKADAITTMAAGVKEKLGPFTDIIFEAIRECKGIMNPDNKRLDAVFKRLEEASIKALGVNEGLDIISGTGKVKQPQTVFSLNEAVTAAVQTTEGLYREWAESLGIGLELKTYTRSSSYIEGNPRDITEAVSRIINNAVEAMSDGGDIYITTEDNNGDAHVYIQDNGTGIPDRHKDRIFDPFFTTKKGAMGLGLSMSGAIIKRHGGDIDFTSRDGEGAIFHIRLPITGQRPVSGKKGRRKKISNSRIMIIQENDVVREILSHPLKIKGCRVTKALNAFEGLAKLKNRAFDMIIADEAALGMERGAFIKKARTAVPELSIALITDTGAGSGIDRRYGCEADLIIKKPVDVNSAVKRISEVLTER